MTTKGEQHPRTASYDDNINLLLIWYSYSDQWGIVNTVEASRYAATHCGLLLPMTPMKLEQRHIDLLISKGALPDTNTLLKSIFK